MQRTRKRLGRIQLQALTPMQIERFYNDLLAEESTGGSGLAPKTVKNTYVVLRKALADAERLDLVYATPHQPLVPRRCAGPSSRPGRRPT